ncbi:MAG: WG repeat-containing protein, partial [Bacteroidales bacterium]|nr:WG repeat-containing protein [Bacteroidales bacterium]
MKTIIFLLFAVIGFQTLSAQPKYDSIGQFDLCKTNWAMIKIDNKLGFINNKGKEIVKPVYDSIGQFDVCKTNWAMIKIGNKLGFINNKGKEVVKPVYDSIGQFDV